MFQGMGTGRLMQVFRIPKFYLPSEVRVSKINNNIETTAETDTLSEICVDKGDLPETKQF
jgi:hypothetical protein